MLKGLTEIVQGVRIWLDQISTSYGTQPVDEMGNKWRRVYSGGGTHFKNWLSQVIEPKGSENVKVEEVDSAKFQCYEESGESMYRIWVKDTNLEGKT